MARVHVIGAGISGLACAVRLANQGKQVCLYEAAAHAGGRCRSYFDPKIERTIDNGNHLLLSANRAALSYLEEIGARDSLIGPPNAAFPFVDLRTGARWTVRPNSGPLPWWIFSSARRIPGTRPGAYLAGLGLAFARMEETVSERLDPGDPLWERFWVPLTVAALNTEPHEAAARLLWMVVKETFLRGEAACRPLIARDGLAPSFVDPALKALNGHGAEIRFNHRLRAIEFTGSRAARLDFGEFRVELAADDWLVIALPPGVASDLLPELQAPQDARPIVNAHILLPEPPRLPPGMAKDLPFLGLIGGTAQWLFLRGDVVSLTISAAEGLVEEPGEKVAERLWADTATALGLDREKFPPMRIIKERRATFAQTPQALMRRAPARTAWSNTVLAGDWTDTGYPATIESAVRSGHTAAEIVTQA